MRKKFGYGKAGKLVRSKSLDILLQDDPSSQTKYRYLSIAELSDHLGQKLLEEATEILEAKDKDELILELADVYEVLESIAKINNITKTQIDVAKEKKAKNRGTFDEGLFVEWIEVAQDTRLYKYCMTHQDKYPELTDDKKD